MRTDSHHLRFASIGTDLDGMRLGSFRIVVGVVHPSPGNKSLFFSSSPSVGPCVLPLLAVHAVFLRPPPFASN